MLRSSWTPPKASGSSEAKSVKRSNLLMTRISKCNRLSVYQEPAFSSIPNEALPC